MEQSSDARRQTFRNAMALLSAAVNVVTTDGPAGRAGLTATAVCSLTDTPPMLMVCVNRDSATNPLFKANGRLCVNVLHGEQETVARDFAGMTGLDMAQRFARQDWLTGPLGQPALAAGLSALEGHIREVQEVGTHSLFFVELADIQLNRESEGLVYFNRGFHRVGQAMPA